MARKKEAGEVLLTVAASVPSMMWRLGISYLRYKRQAKRAGKLFFRSLIANGMPVKEARNLADEYMAAFSLRKMIRQFGI